MKTRSKKITEGKKNFLTQRAIRFFNRYGDELESIRQLLEIKLNQLALAYTLQNNLPRESIRVYSRTKSLKSFLKKLEKKGSRYLDEANN